MTKADHDPTPEPLIAEADRLADKAAATAPTIAVLAQHWTASRSCQDAFDAAWLKQPAGALPAARLNNSVDNLADRHAAIAFLIATLPPKSLSDVVATLAVACGYADDLLDSALTPCERRRLMGHVRRAVFGALPIVAAAAGIDLDATKWGITSALCASRLAGIEVQS